MPSFMSSAWIFLARPTDDCLGPGDDKVVLPSWPEPRERNQEPTIQWQQLRPVAFLGIDRELLLQCQVDDRLLSTTSEEGEDVVKEECCEVESQSNINADEC